MTINSLQNLPATLCPPSDEKTLNHPREAYEPLWKHIQYHFEALNTIFLQVKEFQNKHHIGARGKWILEIDKGSGNFINKSQATLALSAGITIKARNIKNRGQILTQGKFRLISGHRCTWDNQNGLVYAKKGIEAVNAHRSEASSPHQRILFNERGRILCDENNLRLGFEHINNTHGVIKVSQAHIQAGFFNNSSGIFYITHDADLTVKDTFINPLGLVECGGAITGIQGKWSLQNGLIKAHSGINIQAEAFTDIKGSYLFSPRGAIEISSQNVLQHHGKMEAALGIMLLSKEGTVWAPQGTLIAPTGKIQVSSLKGHLYLNGAEIEGMDFEVEALEQVHINQGRVGVSNALCIKSTLGWIDAQKTNFDANTIVLEARKGRIDLADNRSSVSNRMSVFSQFGSFENSQVETENDFEFEGGRFKMIRSSLQVNEGEVLIHSSKSMHIQDGAIQAAQGVTQKSEGWIIGKMQSTHSKKIERQAKNIQLDRCQDISHGTIIKTQNDLALQDYQGEAASIEIGAGGNIILKDAHLHAGEISVKAYAIWLNKAQACFESMRLRMEQTASIHKLKAQGKNLEIKGRNKFSIHQTTAVCEQNIHLVTEGQGYLEQSTLQGQTISSHGGLRVNHSQLHAQQNIDFKDGDVRFEASQIKSAEGAISMQAGSIDSVDNTIQSKALQQKASEINTTNDLVAVQSTIERRARRIVHSGGQEQADTIIEQADHEILASDHKMGASSLLHQTASHLYHKATVQTAADLRHNAGSFQGTHSRYRAKQWKVNADDIQMPNLFADTISAYLQSSKLNICHATMLGNLTAYSSGTITANGAQFLGGNVSLATPNDLFIHDAHMSLNQGMQLYAGNHHGANMRIQNKGLTQMRAYFEMHIPNMQAKVQDGDLKISGGQINSDGSQLLANSIIQNAVQSLSAKNSWLYAVSNLKQTASNGDVNVQGSRAVAGNQIERDAGQNINHQGATSSAKNHIMTAQAVHNVQGEFIGNLEAAVHLFDHTQGRLITLQGVSQIKAQQFITDPASVIEGQGSLHLQGVQAFSGFGKVNLAGSYVVEGSGNMVFCQPIHAGGCSIMTDGCVQIMAPLHVETVGQIRCDQLFNGSYISSDGQFMIDQRQYTDQANVWAKKELILQSVNPIHIQHSLPTPGGLTVVSSAHVMTSVPLFIGGNFIVQAGSIEIQKPLHAKGTGLFRMPGNLMIKRTTATFEQGIDAEVGNFVSLVSRIHSFGPSRILCKEFRLHAASTFSQQGDLHLRATSGAINDASNFLIDGNLFLAASQFINTNHTHTHTVREKVGSRPRKICGIKVGSTPLYVQREEMIVDGIANTQVSQALNMDLSGGLVNDGIINAGSINAKMKVLRNGIFTGKSRTPATYLQPVASFTSSSNFRPGGEISSRQDMNLFVEDKLENRGFIESKGTTWINTGQLENRRRMTTESEEGLKVGILGRHTKHQMPVDHLNPGGEIRGDHVYIHAGQGLNQGGIIEGFTKIAIKGDSFANTPLSMKTLHHFRTGNEHPWKTKKAYSARTDFMGSLISSGGTLSMDLEGRFLNEASDVISWSAFFIKAGEIIQRTLFAAYQSQSAQALLSGKNIQAIVMREGSMQNIEGGLQLVSTKGSVKVEGQIGSYAGGISIDSAEDIQFLANTSSVENKIRKTRYTPLSMTTSTTTFNTTSTSLPSLFSGGSVQLKAKGKVVGEELQVQIKEDLKVSAKEIHTVQHNVEHYTETDGFSCGLEFFGSKALESAFKGQKGRVTVENLLQEDPAIAAVFRTASTKMGPEKALKGLQSAVTLWNEAAVLAQAKNAGNLGSVNARGFGLTNSEGKIELQMTARFNAFNSSSRHTTLFPSNFIVGGNLYFEADVQRHQLQMHVGGDATFLGQDIAWINKTQTSSSEGSSMGFSIDIGPQGFSLSLNAAESHAFSQMHTLALVAAGKTLGVKSRKLKLQGAQLEGDHVDVEAEHCEIESIKDISQQQGWSGSVSLSGAVGFAAESHSISKVGHASGIRARSQGRIQANQLDIIGAALTNLDVHALQINVQDIQEVDSQRTGSLNLQLKELVQFVNLPATHGISSLGSFSLRESKREEIIKPVTGTRETVNTQNQFTGAALLTINTNKLKQEFGDVKQALQSKPQNPLPSSLSIEVIKNKPTVLSKTKSTKIPNAPLPNTTLPKTISHNLAQENRHEEQQDTTETALDTMQWAAHKICSIHPFVQKKCSQSKKLTLEGIEWVKQRTPAFVKDLVHPIISLEKDTLLDLSQFLIEQLVFKGRLKGVKLFSHIPKNPKPKLSHRLDYSAHYHEAAKYFQQAPKEFIGTFSKDLVVVNYHNGKTLGKGRTFAWAMVPTQANKLSTVEAVKDHVALLNRWGKRTHVSVAKIPAGEPVRFLHGKAAIQKNPLTGEIRPGGGVQYRFFDFDPRWIIETRKIPLTPQGKKLSRQQNKISH